MSYVQHYINLHSVMKYNGVFQLVENSYEALKLVKQFHIKSEIIGQWLFCFTNLLIGCQLENIGFWYSYKHCAYVYSGSPKAGIADDENLDEIRSRLGSYKLN